MCILCIKCVLLRLESHRPREFFLLWKNTYRIKWRQTINYGEICVCVSAWMKEKNKIIWRPKLNLVTASIYKLFQCQMFWVFFCFFFTAILASTRDFSFDIRGLTPTSSDFIIFIWVQLTIWVGFYFNFKEKYQKRKKRKTL